MRAQNQNKRARQQSQRDINTMNVNMPSSLYGGSDIKAEEKKKKTFTSKLLGGVNKLLKN